MIELPFRIGKDKMLFSHQWCGVVIVILDSIWRLFLLLFLFSSQRFQIVKWTPFQRSNWRKSRTKSIHSTKKNIKVPYFTYFFGMVLSKLRFFKSQSSNGAPRNETMKYCFKWETRIMSIGGSSLLWDLSATLFPVRISVWFNSFRTKLEDPPDRLWWAWLRIECRDVHSIPRTCKRIKSFN